jgi:hypothetical protein
VIAKATRSPTTTGRHAAVFADDEGQREDGDDAEGGLQVWQSVAFPN